MPNRTIAQRMRTSTLHFHRTNNHVSRKCLRCHRHLLCHPTCIRGTRRRTLARHLPRIQPLLSICHGNIPVNSRLNIKQCHAQFQGTTNNWHASVPYSLPSPITPVACPSRPSSEGTTLYSAVPPFLPKRRVPGPLPSRLLSLNQRADGGVRRFLHVPELRGDPHPWTAQWRGPGDRCKRAERAFIRVSPRRSCRAPS